MRPLMLSAAVTYPTGRAANASQHKPLARVNNALAGGNKTKKADCAKSLAPYLRSQRDLHAVFHGVRIAKRGPKGTAVGLDFERWCLRSTVRTIARHSAASTRLDFARARLPRRAYHRRRVLVRGGSTLN
jgi:hypothetical protein